MTQIIYHKLPFNLPYQQRSHHGQCHACNANPSMAMSCKDLYSILHLIDFTCAKTRPGALISRMAWSLFGASTTKQTWNNLCLMIPYTIDSGWHIFCSRYVITEVLLPGAKFARHYFREPFVIAEPDLHGACCMCRHDPPL